MPQSHGHRAVWATPEKCVLDAPHDLRYFYSLDTAYRTAFASETATVDLVTKFFRDVVLVRPCSWIDHMHALRYLKLQTAFLPNGHSGTNRDYAIHRYKKLESEHMTSADREKLL